MSTAENIAAPDMTLNWSACLTQATETVAPAWPLDQMIAVNPFWGLRERPIYEVSARMATLAGIRSHAPEAIARARQSLEPSLANIMTAASEQGIDRVAQSETIPELALPQRFYTLSELFDLLANEKRQATWHEVVIDQISRRCAELTGQATGHVSNVYRQWLDGVRADRGLAVLLGAPELTEVLKTLPDDADTLFGVAAAELGLPTDCAEAYGSALLWDINGWASRFAWVRWQARLDGGDDDTLTELLGIRLAWDLALWRLQARRGGALSDGLRLRWQRQADELEGLINRNKDQQRAHWMHQRSAELAYQDQLLNTLSAPSALDDAEPPVMQAVFCIDVRSEVIRRHLEAQDLRIQTKGFAGFFGLPIALTDHQYPGSQRPQLPGLLKPALTLSAGRETFSTQHHVNAGLHRVADSSPAIFGLVESMGLGYAFKLLRDSLMPKHRSCTELKDSTNFSLCGEHGELSLDERTDLVAGILGAMGLVNGFAPWVLLVGHGSQSRNNPHAASLDCGACGGHSGESNVRVLCQLLEDRDLRAGLAARGIEIPPGTRFVPALHNTTTDEVLCLDGQLPVSIRNWLDNASAATRLERAPELALDTQDSDALLQQMRLRANDWSQVRPEWGLAGNAAFIAAPRARTRGRDLSGRVFLHDYQVDLDPEFKVLQLILTAPVVVAHWINTQYNVSVADNFKLGAGNKVLHNVVGGNVGVLEGGAGDLRIGLPMQSIHDGSRWMHTPLRLSVYVDAPQSAIKAIYDRQDVVKHLVDNEWLFLFALDDKGAQRLKDGLWH